MKSLVKLFSVAILSFLVTTSFAQQTGPQGPPQGQGPAGQGGQRVQRTPEQTAQAQVDWMTTDLKIDKATQTKVYDVVLKYSKQSSEERTKAMAAGGDMQANMQAVRAKTTEINAAMDKELKVILGDATYAQYTAKAAERRAAARPQGAPQGPPQGAPQGQPRQ
jgi:hypothetical protein